MSSQNEQEDTRVDGPSDSIDSPTASENAATPAPAHTPGPWKVAGFAGEHDEGGARIASVKDGQSVCYTALAIRGMWGQYIADANLIAAAPDLLAALKAVTYHFETTRDFALGNEDAESYTAVDAARAAIAKAEGK